MTQTATSTAKTEQDLPQFVWLLGCLFTAIFDRLSGAGRSVFAYWIIDPTGEDREGRKAHPDLRGHLSKLQTDKAYFTEHLLTALHKISGVKMAPSALHLFPEKTPAELVAMLGDIMAAAMLHEDCPVDLYNAMLCLELDLDNEAQSERSEAAKARHVVPVLLSNAMADAA